MYERRQFTSELAHVNDYLKNNFDLIDKWDSATFANREKQAFCAREHVDEQGRLKESRAEKQQKIKGKLMQLKAGFHFCEFGRANCAVRFKAVARMISIWSHNSGCPLLRIWSCEPCCSLQSRRKNNFHLVA